MKVVGIDLAGSTKNASGFCILDEKLKANVFCLYSDREIINEVKKVKPVIIAIDAPLSLPLGRKNLRKSNIHFRQCDIALRKLKIKFFPITIRGMRKLTARGIKLKKKLNELGYKVIEVYPGGAQDMLEIPRKPNELLLKGLKKLGIKNLNRNLTKDELDAVTCAFVGFCFVKKRYIALGNKKEGLIIMPDKSQLKEIVKVSETEEAKQLTKPKK